VQLTAGVAGFTPNLIAASRSSSLVLHGFCWVGTEGILPTLAETRGLIENGKVAHWQVRVRIGATLDD
jgi:hypothetical protein